MIRIPDGSRSATGSIDLVTLAVAMIPMTLFLILGAYTITQSSVKNEVDIQTNFMDREFESIIGSYHVASFRDTMEDVNELADYPRNTGKKRRKLEKKVEKKLKESTSYLKEKGRRFYVNITNITSRDDYFIDLESPESLGGGILSIYNVPSPRLKPTKFKVSITGE